MLTRQRVVHHLLVSGAVTILFGGIFLATKESFTLDHWPWLVIGWITLSAYGIVVELKGRRDHRNVPTSRRLRWLMEDGLNLESRGHYRGLKGNYRGYFVRIYFNWETNLHRREYELCLMVYFEPPKDQNGKLNVKQLDAINSDLKPGIFSSRRCIMKCEASHLVYHTPFNLFTTSTKVRRRLNKLIERAIELGLHPIGENRVDELVQQDTYLHGPDICYYQELNNAREITLNS